MRPWILCLAIVGMVVLHHVEAATPISMAVLDPCKGPNPPAGCHANPQAPRTPANEYNRGCHKIHHCRGGIPPISPSPKDQAHHLQGPSSQKAIEIAATPSLDLLRHRATARAENPKKSNKQQAAAEEIPDDSRVSGQSIGPSIGEMKRRSGKG
ncbi:hypothetical protein NL676_009261 [Syzygium grande]|nr:hypothetical protein NL676_009261 [Syzygium grande]